jgi:hypothetical protein
MSRWSLLKAAVVEKERRTDSSNSIHRFSGYDVTRKTKIIWPGFEFVVDDAASMNSIQEECELFMERVDTNGCFVLIPVAMWREELVQNLNLSVRGSSSAMITAYAQHSSLVSSLPQCEYWKYEIPDRLSNSGSFCLYSREKPRTSGLNVKALLSNKLHNVDNTGNVCVWPAEPLLLHTLVNVKEYRELVQNKRLLELGGGMTALVGLGLAFSDIAASVVVTDGHPDCVKNQVRILPCCTRLLVPCMRAL